MQLSHDILRYAQYICKILCLKALVNSRAFTRSPSAARLQLCGSVMSVSAGAEKLAAKKPAFDLQHPFEPWSKLLNKKKAYTRQYGSSI